MKRLFTFTISLVFIMNLTIFSSPDRNNKAKYEKYKQDAVLKQIKEKRDGIQKKKDEITKKIKEKQKKEKKLKRKERKTLKTDTYGVFPPKSKESFKSYFHFPPVPQYYTGTCWCFSATSFFESEIYRLTKKKIKLSEMWTVYYELIEKSRRFIKERGNSYVAGGSESNAVTRIWEKYGAAPAEVYTGLIDKGDKYDHIPLMREIKNYLDFIKKHNLWNEKENLKHIALILDKYMGKPPKTFEFNGKTMTPTEFLHNETGLNLDDYYCLISTSREPFYTMQEFKVPDNWWHNKEYINLPLKVWCKIIKKSIKSGYTMVIGGDVSEPGRLGEKDIAFIPTFDIPIKYINQDSREYRIYNRSTGDDHGIHLVGYKRVKGKDWYLIKDSSRSARKGKEKGYYFYREDFIKLKMLTFSVHKDMLKNILPKIKK